MGSVSNTVRRPRIFSTFSICRMAFPTRRSRTSGLKGLRM